jgi:hypothetical protein
MNDIPKKTPNLYWQLLNWATLGTENEFPYGPPAPDDVFLSLAGAENPTVLIVHYGMTEERYPMCERSEDEQ